jgi:amidohydrolase
MMRLGTRTPGGETFDLHRGDYAPDEQAIGVGVRVMAAAAMLAVRAAARQAAPAEAGSGGAKAARA